MNNADALETKAEGFQRLLAPIIAEMFVQFGYPATKKVLKRCQALALVVLYNDVGDKFTQERLGELLGISRVTVGDLLKFRGSKDPLALREFTDADWIEVAVIVALLSSINPLTEDEICEIVARELPDLSRHLIRRQVRKLLHTKLARTQLEGECDSGYKLSSVRTRVGKTVTTPATKEQKQDSNEQTPAMKEGKPDPKEHIQLLLRRVIEVLGFHKLMAGLSTQVAGLRIRLRYLIDMRNDLGKPLHDAIGELLKALFLYMEEVSKPESDADCALMELRRAADGCFTKLGEEVRIRRQTSGVVVKVEAIVVATDLDKAEKVNDEP